MKLIFDPHSVLLMPVKNTVKASPAPSMTVINTVVDEVMRLPQQYSVLTSKNLPRGYGF
jgi:hypothetical protein